MDEMWLSLVRAARDIGDISSLFPPGITRLTDLPFTHHNAISAALSFLTFDELPEEERPPKRIWLDADKMKAHWDFIKRNRESKAEGRGDMTKMDRNPLIDKIKIVAAK